MRDYYYERSENRRYDRLHSKSKSVSIYKYLLMIILFVVVSFFFIVTLKHSTYANDTTNSRKKLYKSITIYAGDDIASIAEAYNDYGYNDSTDFIKELCHINSISESTTLIAGNYLIIPYYEDITL